MAALEDSGEFFKALYNCVKKERGKIWTREYKGFEALNDTAEDLVDEAFAEVVPNGEFDGVVRITVEYIPSPSSSTIDASIFSFDKIKLSGKVDATSVAIRYGSQLADAELCPHGYEFVNHCPDCSNRNPK